MLIRLVQLKLIKIELRNFSLLVLVIVLKTVKQMQLVVLCKEKMFGNHSMKSLLMKWTLKTRLWLLDNLQLRTMSKVKKSMNLKKNFKSMTKRLCNLKTTKKEKRKVSNLLAKNTISKTN